ncbi:MAG: DUF503 domain-containing protein [Kosmotoga sp.]|nr:MAG: DUF503 domain-containing protein [Kosmotoga sp.]
MHFGYNTFLVRLRGVKSLKEKRSIVKRLINDLRKNFNASVVETGVHDSKRELEITVGIITNSKSEMDSLFESIENRVTEWNALEVFNVFSEVW